jgi:hypothetical protein
MVVDGEAQGVRMWGGGEAEWRQRSVGFEGREQDCGRDDGGAGRIVMQR